MNIKENSIVIVEDSLKEKFIEKFRKNNKLFAITVLGLKEFKKRYCFDYTKEAVFHVHQKYGVIKEVAEIYIENLYFLDGELSSPKLKFLSSVKDDLDACGLLIYDHQFREYLKGKDIVLYELHAKDRFHDRIWSLLKEYSNVYALNEETGTSSPKSLYKLPNREVEVAFVASEIAKLLKSGIKIDNIKLANVSTSYTIPLKRIFKDFHIPLELPNDRTIKGTILVHKFEELYASDMAKTLEQLSEYIKSEKDEYIYKKILAVLNEYYWCDDYLTVKDFVLADLAKIKAKTITYKHAVRTIDFNTDIIEDDDYIFLLNFNQGVIPVNKKDEDYLNDETKLSLGLSDSIDINKKRTTHIQNKIAYTKNLVVTYSARDLSGELYISNAYKPELLSEEKYSISFEHSDAYNRKVLLSAKDENKKYGTTNETLERLLNHYKDDPYETYDNTFKGIQESKLKEFLQGKLTLSYSSMNDYYKCSFRYYLSYILKVDKFEDSFATVVGTIFHEVLSQCFNEGFDFEESWSRALSHQEFEFKNMENFYLGLLKEELVFIIENLRRQQEVTELKDALYEQRIEIPIGENKDVIFKGFVDKILYGTKDDTKVAAIIDYKTGHPELDLDNVVHGLDMQLPIYAYLLKNFEPLKDASIGGFYLQKILNNERDLEKKAGALKLQGYSNSNPRILSVVDKTYENSELIKSMKMSKDKFYAYAKTLSDEQIDKMTSIVEEKIKDAAENILSANFAIDPKELAGDNVGCKFCTFKDICYVKNKNIKKIQKMKKEDFLGGEQNGLD